MQNVSFGKKGIQLAETVVEEKLDVIKEEIHPLDYQKIKEDFEKLLAESKRIYNIRPTKEMHDFWITLVMASKIEFEKN